MAALRADPAAMTRASQVFRAVCTGYCHSTQAIQRESPDLFDCHWIHGDSDRAIWATISTGVADTPMQGFGGKLPDDDLWKLVAFIRERSRCQ